MWRERDKRGWERAFLTRTCSHCFFLCMCKLTCYIIEAWEITYNHVPRWCIYIFCVWYIVTFVIPSRPEFFLIIYSFEIISIIKLKNGTMDLLVRFICLMQGWGNIGLKRSVPLGILHLSPHTPLLWYCWLSTREIKKTFWLHTRHQELGSLEKDY